MALLRVATLLFAPALAWGLQLLPPPVQVSGTSNGSVWQVASTQKIIYIESGLADKVDTDGLTLIPPSGNDFAVLFQADISQLTGANWTLQKVDRLPCLSTTSGILLGSFSGNGSSITCENGQPTSEGYELKISPKGAFIGGTGARGMWWGTRTLLQALLTTNGSLPVGRAVDAPAYETRGFMLDAGRKWYAPGFLKELCSYASFFKMSEFHYHLSDNYPLNRGRNESWQDVYSHFSLRPEDESLLPILHGRENETLTREDFADLQSHCAARGVTVIPEIEAPGHCLYLTKWKPELSLPKRDLLNLSHPDTIPTVKRIWSEFLPWFETKEVHVGADEYDSTLADVYIGFVNDMSDFINSTTGKRLRIWGTDEPSDNFTISKDVIIQHWQYGQSDPVLLANSGYDIINSEDWWAYMSLKNDHMPILPARYPQFFDESRVLNFADESGWQWTPADYNPFNTTEQIPHGSPSNKGAILAAWNDNGPDASTQLEAYYAMRRGIALVGARAWSGSRGPVLSEDDVAPSIDFFSPIAPGQNLDRVLSSSNSSDSSYSWKRSNDDGETVKLGQGSKGLNSTLKLSATGPFTLASPDNTLSLDSTGSLIFNADGYLYPLREVSQLDALQLDPGHPGRIWVNVSTSTHEEVKVPLPANITIETDALHGSMAWVNGEFAGRFEVFVYGGRNTQFSWSQMAFTAPLESVTGRGLQGLVVEELEAGE
ncbi:putative glycosyl hydrolase family 20 [Colletotrichum karsti]|uniref:beta-N-acetylhexosaminidase n=1 Tax=Colletotrichum karsti TaxID=1095194 RepID=A0A9P6HXK0_9PEZI|nr:putative glycosyl hydrolase family 20 [Colletotrichum karsti]KAF9873072.1 putative glycosyl hydrolase family 20 [Colletotrichum karsti]